MSDDRNPYGPLVREIAQEMNEINVQSDTPRTDAAAMDGWDYLAVLAPLEFTKRLERELVAARDEVSSVIKYIPQGCVVHCCEGGGLENIHGTLALSVAKLTVERRRLTEALAALRADVKPLVEIILYLRQMGHRMDYQLAHEHTTLINKQPWLAQTGKAEGQ